MRLNAKPQNVENAHFPLETHDYGLSKRNAAYRFFAKRLNISLTNILDKNGRVDEKFVTILKQEQLHAFDQEHKRPANAIIGNEAVEQLFNDLKRN